MLPSKTVKLIVRPPMEWVDRGPRTMVQRGYEGRYPQQTKEAQGR